MKYEIKKLNVNGAGYERSKIYPTARELLDDLKWIGKSENGWFRGKGAHILRDGELIATTEDYEAITMPKMDLWTGQNSIPTPSIKLLISQHWR